MTFTEIFRSDASTEAKLQDVASLVLSIRIKYGNTDVEIDMPEVNTDLGIMKLSYLANEDKLELAKLCIKDAIIVAAEEVEANQGTLFDRVVEQIVATSPVLCNITISTGSVCL